MRQIQEPLGPVGRPFDRVDGRLKVTGRACYSAEAMVTGCAHAVIVQSTIASGRITSIDASAAEAAPGVLAVITRGNMPKLKSGQQAETRMPLSDDVVHYAGQHVAVVVADTLERAVSGARLVRVRYAERTPVLEIGDPRAKVERPADRFGEPLQVSKGPVDSALADAGNVVVRGTYVTPVEHHNPMEPSATIAAWQGDDRLTLWDATQGVSSRRATVARALGLELENVRVISRFLGGGFGCKGDAWPHALLAAVAARHVGRPVKLALTRGQMFTSCGHRPETRQTVSLAATADGRLRAIRHDSEMHDSPVGHHVEPCGAGSSAVMYETPALAYTHAVTQVNIASATFMRAPGENPGTFALETAMDELAYKLGIDPLALREINYSDAAPSTGLPFSTKSLREAYRLGAERFGWAPRARGAPATRTRDGRRIGRGMATATYPAHRFPNQARIKVHIGPDGEVRAIGQCATQDLGTGAYTACAQMTAMVTGLPMERVTFELGDTRLPAGGVSGGSATTAGVGQALSEAATKLRDHLLQIAKRDAHSPLASSTPDRVTLRGDELVDVVDASRRARIADLIRAGGNPSVEGTSDASPNGADDLGSKRKINAFQSFGVHFVEVEIDDPVPLVRVRRVVSVMDVGQVVNPKTARSQVQGGVIMGIGQALMERTVYDPRTGRPVNDNLADYAVPVNPDIGEIEVHFVGVPDMKFNAIGCRGVGEIGITGIAAAIGNAVFDATGRRIRELPITPDKLL